MRLNEGLEIEGVVKQIHIVVCQNRREVAIHGREVHGHGIKGANLGVRERNRGYFWNHDFDAENDGGYVFAAPEAIGEVHEEEEEEEKRDRHCTDEMALRRNAVGTHSQQTNEQTGHDHEGTTCG